MKETASGFIAKSTIKAADKEHRRKINFNISKYTAMVPNGKEQFSDINFARERAKNIKWKAIETLDKQLENFEAAIMKRGAKVIWAEDAQQALDAIQKICEEKKCKSLVKSKSMVTEEIHLNHFLEKNGIESVETDLGEYIQQLDGEAPYHIVTPAMHKSKEDIAKLFHEKLHTDPNLSPEQLTLVAREKMREKYVQAEIGITGANFIIADIGAIALTENEGNARLSCAFPRTHIVITGIEKIIPSMTDLGLFWPLLATYGTGHGCPGSQPASQSVLTAARQPKSTEIERGGGVMGSCVIDSWGRGARALLVGVSTIALIKAASVAAVAQTAETPSAPAQSATPSSTTAPTTTAQSTSVTLDPVKLDPKQLTAQTQSRAIDGIVAYSAVCTHAGCEVTDWKADTQLLFCACHESEFDPKDGAKVIDGPAARHQPEGNHRRRNALKHVAV